MKKILWLLVFLLCISSVSATNWYVDNAASNGNGQSWDNAWQSFADIGWSSVHPGDTVYISGGATSKTYTETLTIGKSGTAGNPIIITIGIDASHDGEVIIDGQNTRSNGITVGSYDYIIIDDLTIQNHLGHGQIYANGASYLTVRNNTITHPQARGLRCHNCDYALIQDNTIGTGAIDNSAQTDGIYIGNDGNDNIIDGNTIIIDNSRDYGGPENEGPHVDPIQSYQETRLTVRNNYFEIKNGNPRSQGMIVQKTYVWAKIYNNIVLGSAQNSFQQMFLEQQSGNENIGDLYVWNNVVYDQKSNGGIALRIANWGESHIKAVKNNILINPDGLVIQIDNQNQNIPSGAIDSNLFYRADGGSLGRGASYDSNAIYLNPQLNSEYKPIDSNSPVVDSGTPIADFSTDKEGNSRGSVWDIGAYEFGNGGVQCDPADTNCDGCIQINEISSYVQSWLNGGVSIVDVNNAILLWLSGAGCST